ncbi:MAG TPA: PIN domain-containing protein [Rectinemataceae bacterium]|nr:PIN domain-containing protein [Rectinemataceae bacterium]
MPGTERWLPDANTILRYLLGDDADLSAKATEFWEGVREGRRIAFLREAVLLECVYVLQRFYKVPRAAIAERLRGLLAYKGLVAAEQELLDQSLELYGRESLDYIDCLLASSAFRGDGQVFSFDKKLNKLAAGNR